jgi:hypothetical protein
MAAALCLWSSRGSPLRAMHARFTMWRGGRRLIGVGGLDAALEQQFNLIASYVALAIECGAVFVVAFGALQAISALFRAIATGQATGIEGRQIWLRFATWILLGLRSPPTSCARRWRRPGTTSQSSPSSPPSAPCSTTSWRRTSWPSTRARKRARQGAQSRQKRRIKALLISWTPKRICGSVPLRDMRAQGPKTLELRQVARVSGVSKARLAEFGSAVNGRLDRGG